MKDRFNLAFPSLLLVAVAVFHFSRAREVQQSGWRGGGFADFSATDSPGSRFVRCVMTGSTGECRVAIPAQFHAEAERCLVAPTEENLIGLAGEVMALRWTKDEGAGRGQAPGYRPVDPNEPPPPAEAMLEVTKIRIEVWRRKLSADGNRLEAVLIRAFEAQP